MNRSRLFSVLLAFCFISTLALPLLGAAVSAEPVKDGASRAGEGDSPVDIYVVGETLLAMDAGKSEGVDFTIRVISNMTTDKFIKLNTTATFDTAKWQPIFSEDDIFKVEKGKPVDVTVNIQTNYSASDVYQQLDLGIYGDEYRKTSEPGEDDEYEDTDLDTNTVLVTTFVARRYDPILTFDASEAKKTVTHKDQTAFRFTLQNRGYQEGVPEVFAQVFDDNDDWRVRVEPGDNIGVFTLKSMERQSFTVNVTGPNNILTGEYEIQVSAGIGTSGYTPVSVFARIPRPDLSVVKVDSDHLIAFVNSDVELRVLVQNDGGRAEDVLVTFNLKDSDGALIPIGTTVIPAMSNYNRTYASVGWNTQKFYEERATETYEIEVYLDEEGEISEELEGNNEGSGSLTVMRETSDKPSFSSTSVLLIGAALILVGLSTGVQRKKF